MFRIDRCVCMGRSFEELSALARANRWNLRDLQRQTACGLGCGLCVPYLEEMLRTGQTEFRTLIREQSAPCPEHTPVPLRMCPSLRKRIRAKSNART